MLFGIETGGDASRASAHNKDIQDTLLRLLATFADAVDGLNALLHAVFDKAHATKFSSDEDALHVGFKVLVDMGQVYAACLGADAQGDGLDGAAMKTCTMANTIGSIDDGGLSIDNTQDVFFGAFGDAGSTTNTGTQIDMRVEGNRLKKAIFFGLGNLLFYYLGAFFVGTQVDKDNDQRKEDDDGIGDDLL